MRINLVTPFAEKDAVKALGARWDAAKKYWYIVDVADLAPLKRWISDRVAATAGTGDESNRVAKDAVKTQVNEYQSSPLDLPRCRTVAAVYCLGMTACTRLRHKGGESITSFTAPEAKLWATIPPDKKKLPLSNV